MIGYVVDFGSIVFALYTMWRWTNACPHLRALTSYLSLGRNAVGRLDISDDMLRSARRLSDLTSLDRRLDVLYSSKRPLSNDIIALQRVGRVSDDVEAVRRSRRNMLADVVLRYLRDMGRHKNVNCCSRDPDVRYILTGVSVGVGFGTSAGRRAVRDIMMRWHNKRNSTQSILLAMLAIGAPTL